MNALNPVSHMTSLPASPFDLCPATSQQSITHQSVVTISRPHMITTRSFRYSAPYLWNQVDADEGRGMIQEVGLANFLNHPASLIV